MTTDFRALCSRMADELDRYRRLLRDDRREVHPLATEARTALVETQPEPPTDEELDELFAEIDQSGEPESWRAYARAALDRWGNYPAPPNRSTQTQPKSPTKAQVKQLFDDHSGYIDDEQVMWWSDFYAAARAALVRWGNSANG